MALLIRCVFCRRVLVRAVVAGQRLVYKITRRRGLPYYYVCGCVSPRTRRPRTYRVIPERFHAAVKDAMAAGADELLLGRDL